MRLYIRIVRVYRERERERLLGPPKVRLSAVLSAHVEYAPHVSNLKTIKCFVCLFYTRTVCLLCVYSRATAAAAAVAARWCPLVVIPKYIKATLDFYECLTFRLVSSKAHHRTLSKHVNLSNECMPCHTRVRRKVACIITPKKKKKKNFFYMEMYTLLLYIYNFKRVGRLLLLFLGSAHCITFGERASAWFIWRFRIIGIIVESDIMFWVQVAFQRWAEQVYPFIVYMSCGNFSQKVHLQFVWAYILPIYIYIYPFLTAEKLIILLATFCDVYTERLRNLFGNFPLWEVCSQM